jgi:PAS domain S-box-containing protein
VTFGALAAEELERQCQMLFDNNPLPAWIYDVKTLAFRKVNDAAVRVYGYSRAEFLAMTIGDIRPPQDLAALRANVSTQHELYQHSGPWRHRKKNGEILLVNIISHEIQGNGSRLVIVEDITEKVASDEKFRILFEQSSDAYFILAGDVVIQCNATAARMLRAPAPDTLIGLPLFTLAPERQPDGKSSAEMAEEARRILKAQGLYRRDWIHRRLDGTEFSVEVTLTPIRIGHRILTLAIWHDLTDRRLFESALEKARDEAQAAARLKSEFLATMSHEIRTPMNAVIALTELLLDTPLSSEQKGFVDTIHVAGEALLATINDILDFSRIEAGRLEMENGNLDLQSAADECVRLVSETARQKALPIHVEIDPQIPEKLRGDGRRLKQVLLNLLANAVKFTERGEIRLSVASELRQCETTRLRFVVADTGIGIPPPAQAQIFEPFRQSDASTTRRYGGTGLGLAIAKRLVELMGGEIGVESQPGVGSRFWFTLPFAIAAQAEPVEAKPAAPAFSAHTGRILVAEDNPVNQKVTRALIHKLGYEVDIAPDGLQAVAAVRATSYDAVLMDCNMPGMDGFEATRKIRASESGGPVPIIALTAHALDGDRDKCIAAGMDDYLAKPIRLETLKEKLETWIGRAGVRCAALRG